VGGVATHSTLKLDSFAPASPEVIQLFEHREFWLTNLKKNAPLGKNEAKMPV
jgi:hypothetical protein